MLNERPRYPVAGVDYPRTLGEFQQWFASEAACQDYLERVRWRDGFVCPDCGGTQSWKTRRGLFRCTSCQRQTSVTAGTVFEGTRKPLQMWLQALWYITGIKQGGSAMGLRQVLGLGSYQTAWAWLHKLRRAMVRPGRDRLTGEVEVDETYLGGVEHGVDGRETQNKNIVAIAVEIRGRAMGRVRLAHVADVSAHSLVSFVCGAVTEGSTVRTDGWWSYTGLPAHGYDHRPIKISKQSDPAHVVMPHVHRIASLLQRWCLGTYQGAIRSAHLDYYLDEFTFRFNRRRSRSRGLLFHRLVEQALHADPVPYRSLVGGKSLAPSHNP